MRGTQCDTSEETLGFLDTGMLGKCSAGERGTAKSGRFSKAPEIVPAWAFSFLVDPSRDSSTSWSRAVSHKTALLRVKFCHRELSRAMRCLCHPLNDSEN